MKLYLHTQHGLCNRLRALLSGMLLAQISGRELVLIWENDCHCECIFSDLFDNSGFEVYNSINEIMDWEDIYVYNYMENEDNPAKTRRINYNIKKDLYIKTAYVLENYELNWKDENEMFKKLVIKGEINKKIDDYARLFGISGCVGFHIRSQMPNQKNKFDSNENWKKESHEKIVHWRKMSSYSRFSLVIDKILKRKLIPIFIATDEKENIIKLKQKYSNNIYYVEREVFDRSKEEIQYALIDLVLLSRCREIYGSYWSSFSEVAHRLSGKKEINYSGINF